MFSGLFHRNWSTLKNLIWLRATALGNRIVTLTGSIVSFFAKKSSPFLSLQLNLAPVQSGSGDPSPDNVRPISGWSGDIHAYVYGESLVNAPDSNGTHEGIDFTVSDGNRLTFSGTTDANTAVYNFTLTDKITVKAGETLSAFMRGKIERTGGNLGLRLLTASNATITTLSYQYAVGNNYATWTADADCEIAKIQVRVGANKTYDVDVNLMFSLEATTITATISSPPGTVYGGTLDLVSGVLSVEMARVDLGSLSWDYQSTRGYFYANMPSDVITAGSKSSDGYCDIFKLSPSIRSEDFYASDMTITYCNTSLSSAKRAFVRDTDYTDKTTFKAAMSGHYLVYLLATPVTYQLSPQAVNTIVGQNNVWGDSQTVTVQVQL